MSPKKLVTIEQVRRGAGIVETGVVDPGTELKKADGPRQRPPGRPVAKSAKPEPTGPQCGWDVLTEKLSSTYNRKTQIGKYRLVERYECPPGATNAETLVGTIRTRSLHRRAPADPDPQPAALAQRAYNTLHLPKPTTNRFPASHLHDGTPDTLIGTNVWFWTDKDKFSVLRQHTETPNGRVSVDLTVTPVALTVDPGDGSPLITCLDGGTPWRGSPHSHPADIPASNCGHNYQRSTAGYPDRMLTATFTTRWRVSWTGTGNTAGRLPDITTTSTARYAISEIQALNN